MATAARFADCAWRLLLVAALSACGEMDEPGDDLDRGKTPQSAAELYSDSDVWRIDLQLSDASYRALEAEPRTYVRGTVQIGDAVIEDVGVRLKGAFSFQGLGGKASFKVKFGAFVPGQRYLGLERLTLNNMRQDRSEIHEWLSYRVFQAAGVPAPRASYARVTLNGTLYGLYANVETVDDRFLSDRYSDGDGNLYEATWGADLDEESVDLFEQDEGDDTSRADLDALVDWVAEPGDAIFFDEDSPLDTEEFLRFVAAEAIVGHWDGYWKSNNYFLYHEHAEEGPEEGRWTFMPWGLDQSFGEELSPFDSRGILAERCFRLSTCMAEYTRIGVEVTEAFAELRLDEEVLGVAAHIAPFAAEDPRSPHPPEKLARFQNIAKARLAVVADEMRTAFSCIEDGQEVDRDDDGFGACQADCNDASADAHPGEPEVCDGIDNDCDGSVDELACECEQHELAGGLYAFCDARVSFSVARDLCEARGGWLASFSEDGESAAAYRIAHEITPERSWYLGASDGEEEGIWRDIDGVRLETTGFAPGEPDDFGGQHCAALASFADGGWDDVRCSEKLPYICQLEARSARVGLASGKTARHSARREEAGPDAR